MQLPGEIEGWQTIQEDLPSCRNKSTSTHNKSESLYLLTVLQTVWQILS